MEQDRWTWFGCGLVLGLLLGAGGAGGYGWTKLAEARAERLQGRLEHINPLWKLAKTEAELDNFKKASR